MKMIEMISNAKDIKIVFFHSEKQPEIIGCISYVFIFKFLSHSGMHTISVMLCPVKKGMF